MMVGLVACALIVALMLALLRVCVVCGAQWPVAGWLLV